jgi:WD40 repeat protein
MGSPRVGCHPRLRIFGRQDLRPYIQRCGTSPSRSPTHRKKTSFPSYSDWIKCIDDGQWGADVFEAHAIGCNAVSWAPAARAGSLLAAPNAGGARSPPVKRFASAGCDNIVKLWGFSEETQAWVEEDVLEGHADWVRDVAWAPNIGLPRSYIATASQVSS